MLPQDVLMEIFDWYLGEDQDDFEVDAWYPLVHVCRSWRNIIFSAPHRLNLRLLYTAKDGKPACEMLGVWPSFPIILQVASKRPWIVENVTDALKYKDRIRKIQLVDIYQEQLKDIFLAMQEPFPALTDLLLTSSMEDEAPDSLLGGSAPRLRSLKLDSISYPGLSNLVSSATDLVELSLLDVPSCGVISPQTMVTVLSALTRLETLSLSFEIDDDDPDSTLFLDCSTERNPTLPTRSVLPSLKFYLFRGMCGYLEEFVAMIDAPRLEILDITLALRGDDSDPLDDLKSKETPQFNHFLCRTEMFNTLNNASIHLWHDKLEITLSRKPWACNAKLSLRVMCQKSIHTLGRVCVTQFLPLSKIESLGISSQYHKWQSHRETNAEDIQWRFSLFYFSAVKSLYLSKEIVPSIACGLEQVLDSNGGRSQVLRSLQKLSTVKPLPSGSVKTVIEKFAAMRGLSAMDPPTLPFSWVATERNTSNL